MEHHLHPNPNSELKLNVTPASAGWQYLSFSALSLPAGGTHSHLTEHTEIAIVPLSGEGHITVGDQSFTLKRENVFAGKPDVLYVPPKHEIKVEANSDFEFSLGSAPAQGKYPLRLFKPEEMKSEMRGGGTALRQVNHILAAPLPAERLILFEVYVPGGTWSGWPLTAMMAMPVHPIWKRSIISALPRPTDLVFNATTERMRSSTKSSV